MLIKSPSILAYRCGLIISNLLSFCYGKSILEYEKLNCQFGLSYLYIVSSELISILLSMFYFLILNKII